MASGRADPCEVAIVDPHSQQRYVDGRVGEIWLRGPSVARGYWGKPLDQSFAARLSGDAEDYLRTGDLGFVADGELYVTGRLKDLLIVNGRNILPQDIEQAAVDTEPRLRASRSAAVGTDRDGQEHIVLIQGVPPTVEPTELHEIEARIRSRVAYEHGVALHRIVFLPDRQIPITSSGKIMRSAAAKLLLERHSDGTARSM